MVEIKEKIINLIKMKSGRGDPVTVEWVAKRTQRSILVVSDLMVEMVKEGILQKKKNAWILTPFSPKKKEAHPVVISVLKWICAIIAAGCLVISIMYSQIFFTKYMNIIASYIFAILWVSAAVSFWQLFKYSADKKYIGRSILFGVISLILTIYSMWATVVVQYEKHTSSKVSQQKEDNVLIEQKEIALLQIKSFTAQKESLKAEIEQAQIDIELYRGELAQFEPGEYRYNVATWRKKIATDRYDTAKGKLERVTKEEDLFLKESAHLLVKREIEKKDFKTYVEAIFSADASMFFFWISTFPSVFIDIISPVALMVVFFSWDRKRREKDRQGRVIL